MRPDLGDGLRQSLQPVAADDAHVLDTTVTQLGQHRHPMLGAFTAVADPQPEHVAATIEADTDSHVDRARGDLTIPDLDPDTADHHDRVHAIERAGLPFSATKVADACFAVVTDAARREQKLQLLARVLNLQQLGHTSAEIATIVGAPIDEVERILATGH